MPSIILTLFPLFSYETDKNEKKCIQEYFPVSKKVWKCLHFIEKFSKIIPYVFLYLYIDRKDQLWVSKLLTLHFETDLNP